jgi:hypothetical protein
MSIESDIQFVARMIVAVREGHQIASVDAKRLNNLATYGDSLSRTTMPEERRAATEPFAPPEQANDLVRD